MTTRQPSRDVVRPAAAAASCCQPQIWSKRTLPPPPPSSSMQPLRPAAIGPDGVLVVATATGTCGCV